MNCAVLPRVYGRIFRARLADQVRKANTRELCERPLAIKLREWRAGEQRQAVRVTREQVLGPGVEKVQRRSKQSLLRRKIRRQRGAFAEKLLRIGKDRKSRSYRPVANVWLRERKTEAALPVARREIERENLAAPEQVVCRIVQAKERSADSRNAAVERNFLAAFLGNFYREVDQRLFFIRAKVRVLVLIDRIEVPKLI